MRDASTVTPPSSTSRHVPKPNASWDRSPRVTGWSTSLALGPQTPSVVQAEVRSLSWAPGGRWSVNHFFSAMPVAPPVTTRKCSAPSRITVRSALNPPPASSSDV